MVQIRMRTYSQMDCFHNFDGPISIGRIFLDHMVMVSYLLRKYHSILLLFMCSVIHSRPAIYLGNTAVGSFRNICLVEVALLPRSTFLARNWGQVA